MKRFSAVTLALVLALALANANVCANEGRGTSSLDDYAECSRGATRSVNPYHLWASINKVAKSIYPTSDAEYKPALGKILVSWRMQPTDTYETAYELYRVVGTSRTKLSGLYGIIQSTCYADNYTQTNKDVTYELYYKDGKELLDSYTITAAQLQAGVPYVNIPLQHWDKAPAGFWYKVNDASYGDLDGDGEPEIILKRGARTDSIRYLNGGTSDDDRKEIRHTTIWEAYKLDGTLLWRVFSGPNIGTGNVSSFAVYDFDKDGKCEVATRLSEGSVFGDGKEIGDVNNDGITDYRTFTTIHTHGAPEFLSVIDGVTGKELARAPYIPTGSSSEAWGDNYWKRANSIRIAVGQFAEDTTSILICRGVYARSAMQVYDYYGGELHQRWSFDSNNTGCKNYAGQGYHSLFMADVDDDGMDEIVYGSMTVDHDGSPMYVSGSFDGKVSVLKGKKESTLFTGFGHGDALHVGDFLPEHPGLEIWSCFETGDYGAALRDARTGEALWYVMDNTDVGRCSIADVFADSPGCEMWCYNHPGIFDINGNEIKTDAGGTVAQTADNMAIWFTGSLNRQLLDGNKVCQPVRATGKERRALRANFFGAKAINGTKNNPCLYADILGDWREEIIYVDSAENNLMLFSTWYPTDYRFPSLTTDHHYEMSVLNQNIGYNQPNEMGTYFGSDLLTTVTFNEVNGLKPSYFIYVDSLMKSKIDNGKLFAERTYYLKAIKSGYTTYTSAFTFTKDNKTVEVDMVNGPLKRGDANNDKSIDVADITAIATYILGTTPESWREKNADANNDGTIDVADITTTASIILKK